ncbi:MarR family transcriptional regulator [Paenibacillus dendritiformis]|uniref:MarR family transcriptional regulator n=1 Tax=Paenibacillus TaxID=44249 RepID=UPI001059D6B4|nr:MarR family transcriptional regulator [Paenibacillus dendritiformis]TDL57050.1 MarR family transcriptional regulator [Paenibacillus dendritiformis]WGU95121.1 MarR family transcriptional regulator [Paenibacillus dendritiformis]
MERMSLWVDRYEQAMTVLARTLWHDMTNVKELGLTIGQYSLLNVIERRGPGKVSMLAEQLGVTSSAVTVMIDRLLDSGLVDRYPDKSDRRVVLVSITEAGLHLLRQAQDRSRRTLTAYLSLLEEDELEQLVRLGEKLAAKALVYKGGQ